jgi:glyoxylase-like metal-dependent hydrolase (beta-lactamase superfamily II)
MGKRALLGVTAFFFRSGIASPQDAKTVLQNAFEIRKGRITHMRLRKIIFRFAILTVFGPLSTLAAAQMQPPPVSVKPLTGGVYWTQGGAGGNTGLIIGKDGVVVVDAKTTPESAKEMLDDLAKLTPKPVTHVILTHSDRDHVNGLAAFPKGLTIIAQVNCKKEIEESFNGPEPSPRDYVPTKTVDKEESLSIDGVRLQLLHFAPGHTSGDLIVYLPEQKIVFTGDLIVSLNPYPLIHLEKHGTSAGWIESVKGMLALDADTYVPGHGDLQTKADIQNRLARVEERREKIKELVAQGKSLDEVKAALGDTKVPVPLPGAPRFPAFTETTYNELTGKN